MKKGQMIAAGLSAVAAAGLFAVAVSGPADPSQAEGLEGTCEQVLAKAKETDVSGLSTDELETHLATLTECRGAMTGNAETSRPVQVAQQSAAEADVDALAKCTEIASSVERLACFDLAAGRSGLSGETKPAPAKGQWHAWTDANKFTDRTDAYAYVDAKEAVRIKSYKSSRPRLYIRCADNTTAFVIDFGGFITTDSTRLRYRIGNRKPAASTWRMSTNYESAGLWNGGASIPFIKSLFGEETFLVEVTPHGESPISVEFNIVGIEEAAAGIRKYCGW